MPPNARPTSSSTGSTRSGARPETIPSRYITSRIAAPDSTDLSAAHAHSPSTTSVLVIGACRIPSHVRCTFNRENAEYSPSNEALFIVL
jgi:hypothetical protein